MPRVKSKETCAEAIRSLIRPGKVMSFSELSANLKKTNIWKDDTIWQHLMGLVVNLPPARYHWKNARPFLFIRADGRYELYNPGVHPEIIE